MTENRKQTAIITGASEGIGKAIANALAARGIRLALAARTEARLKEFASQLQAAGHEVLAYPADVTQAAQVDALVKTVVSAFGQIDILVNNVGQGLRKPFVETTDQDWHNLIAINLSSSFYCCRAVIPTMRLQGSGHIINIASRAGVVGEGGLAAYSAVKHGVVGLTKALAEEEASHGIHINAICPGPVRTERMQRLLPQVDQSNWLTPEDIAQAVLFLLTSPGHTMQGKALEMF